VALQRTFLLTSRHPNPSLLAQVVWHLAAQLRACPDLSFIDEVLEFVGHTANAAGKSGGALDVGGPSGLELLAAGQSPSSGKGMSGDQQQRVMQRFKVGGATCGWRRQGIWEGGQVQEPNSGYRQQPGFGGLDGCLIYACQAVLLLYALHSLQLLSLYVLPGCYDCC
jgi:hypothetical protein